MSLELCRRLLARALSFATDAVIANGAHVYWDLVHGPTGAALAQRPDALAAFGAFNLDESVLGGPNEEVLKRVVGPQIADLYGTMLRSTPVFFLRDDHDYFENDYFFEADTNGGARASFPPDGFHMDAALPPVQLELVERMIVLA